MKLLQCCLAVTLITTIFAALDVERTVQQVQRILKENSELPRLSRDDIIQLLNDIRAEDAKSKSSSTEHSKEILREELKTTTPYSPNKLESTTQYPDIQDNIVADEHDFAVSMSAPTTQVPETTSKGEPTVMVVLPYTPRDGSSLQELYTKPPKVEVVPESKVTRKPLSVKANERLKQTLKHNAQIAKQKQMDFPAELQAFLDAHGLKGTPGQDHFLLPLEGFKPLPPARVIDGRVQLPENIILTYDLISSDIKKTPENAAQAPVNNFMYEPLRPQIPFELDTSSSEQQKTVLPLDLPKRKTKSTGPKPNYEPVDYESVKVIPLNLDPNPIDDDRVVLTNDYNKRQTNISIVSTSTNEEPTTTDAPAEDTKEAITNSPPASDSVSADTDSGASIADLADSFGGAAPEKPGDSEIPPPKKNGFYWMLDWNSFLEVGDGDTKVNIRFEPKLGDPQMFVPVSVP